VVSAALSYIDRRFPGCGFLRRFLHVYRLFVSQGRQLIDRYAIISNEEMFDIQVHGREQFVSLVQDSRQGVILLTAHTGNWQVAMMALKKAGITVYALMRPEDNLAVQNSLHIGHEQENIKIISSEQHLGGVVEVINVLKEGHVVSIMGDRSYGFNALEVSFLGEKAWFPYGAFTIAAATGCPVVVLLSAKVSPSRYIVDISNVLYPRYEGGRKNKRQQLQQWVQKFVTLLDTHVNRYPYQCFLFYNIWRKETESEVG
jgi:predicted LPLAT superfamily acyltransferase